MRLRRAQIGDLDGVLAIEGAWPTTPRWTRRQFEAELESTSVFLVAEELAAVVGYAVAWVLPPEGQLLDLAVRPDSARKGVGRKLLLALLVELKKQGCSRLTLEVSALNQAALSLYRSIGARVVGRRPRFYNDGSDAVLMDLELP